MVIMNATAVQIMKLSFSNLKSKIFVVFLSCVMHIHAQEFVKLAMLSSPVFYSGTINGAGVFFADTGHIYFITARHNLFSEKPPYKLIQRQAMLSFYPNNILSDTAEYIVVDLKDAFEKGCIQYDSLKDIAVIAIAAFRSNKAPSGKPQYYPFIIKKTVDYVPAWLSERSDLYKDVEVGGSVNTFGYPMTLGLKQTGQFSYEHPLLRKGDISGKSEKLKTIVIYTPIYTGNTGGPVFEVKYTSQGEKIRLIGIVGGPVPLSNKLNNQNVNSDYSIVIPIDGAIELIKSVKQL